MPFQLRRQYLWSSCDGTELTNWRTDKITRGNVQLYSPDTEAYVWIKITIGNQIKKYTYILLVLVKCPPNEFRGDDTIMLAKSVAINDY